MQQQSHQQQIIMNPQYTLTFRDFFSQGVLYARAIYRSQPYFHVNLNIYPRRETCHSRLLSRENKRTVEKNSLPTFRHMCLLQRDGNVERSLLFFGLPLCNFQAPAGIQHF